MKAMKDKNDKDTQAISVSSKKTEKTADIKKIPAPTPIPRTKALETPPTSSEPTPPTPPTSTQPAPAPAPPASSEPAVASVTSTTSEPAQRVVKKNEGTPKWLPGAIIGGIAALFLLFIVGFILLWNATKSSTPPVVSTNEGAEIIRLKAEMEALREQAVTPPAPVVVPPQVVHVPTNPAPLPPGVEMGKWEQVPPVTRGTEPRGTEVVKVVRWLEHRDSNGSRFLVPLRDKDANGDPLPPGPNGERMAGYGRLYSNPPEGGGTPPPNPQLAQAIRSGKAPWTRNERGDWALPLQ